MSAILKFAEGVADDVGRLATPAADDGTSVRKAVNWASLIETVISVAMELIGNCPNNDAKLKESLRGPSVVQRGFMLFKVKSACDCNGAFGRFRGDVRAIADSMIGRVAQMAEPELDGLIAEVRGFQNDPF